MDSVDRCGKLARVYQIAERFGRAWQEALSGGPVPLVQDYVAEGDEASRALLLRELLLLDLQGREALGQPPRLEAYLACWPQFEPEIRLAFWMWQSGITDHALETPGGQALASTVSDDTVDDVLDASVRQRPCEPPPPRVIGEYEILREAGRGPAGVVYHARRRSTGHAVALKLLRFPRGAHVREMTSLQEQLRTLQQLGHGRIVPVYDVGWENGRAYMAAKWVEGSNLAELSRQCPVPAHLAARLVADVAEAIEAAHRVGVVHGNLKPENILVDRSAQVHIVDFGIACCLEAPWRDWTNAEQQLLEAPLLMRTPSYMAPEQLRADASACAAAVDVYGLGAVLYELLTGRPPFRAPSIPETVQQVLERSPIPPGKLAPHVDPPLDRMVCRCLAKDPRDRFSSIAAFRRALQQYLRGERMPLGTGRLLRRLWAAVVSLAATRERTLILSHPLSCRGHGFPDLTRGGPCCGSAPWSPGRRKLVGHGMVGWVLRLECAGWMSHRA